MTKPRKSILTPQDREGLLTLCDRKAKFGGKWRGGKRKSWGDLKPAAASRLMADLLAVRDKGRG